VCTRHDASRRRDILYGVGTPLLAGQRATLGLTLAPAWQNDKLADSSQPVILRITSASYLASFLVRSVLRGVLPGFKRWHCSVNAGSLRLSVACVCAAVLGSIKPLVRSSIRAARRPAVPLTRVSCSGASPFWTTTRSQIRHQPRASPGWRRSLYMKQCVRCACMAAPLQLVRRRLKLSTHNAGAALCTVLSHGDVFRGQRPCHGCAARASTGQVRALLGCYRRACSLNQETWFPQAFQSPASAVASMRSNHRV